MQSEESRLAAVIEQALLDQEYDADVARDVAFHMTDWLRDLRDYSGFCANPEALDAEAILDLLMRFLVHVPVHVNAAHRILMDDPVTDPFGIGAVSESDSSEA